MKIVPILLIALVLHGCTSFGDDKKATTLDSTLFAYQTAMRWGQWEALFNYRNVKAPPPPALPFNNIRVTAYEIRQPPVPVQEDQVLQVVEIQYVLTDEQRVHTALDKQDWRYDADARLWSLYSPFPELR
jgi:hypothetical protein